MNLSLQNFNGLIQTMSATAQAACNKLIDFTVGSVSLALTQGCAAMGLWLQYMVLSVLMQTRLATSFGDDADSFCGQFSLPRVPGAFASGVVTLSRFFATSSAVVLVGTKILSSDRAASFAIVADPSNPLYDATVTDPGGNVVGGFVIPSGTQSANFTATATVSGTSGNVTAGTITILGSAVIGIDFVTNAAPFTGGLEPETDEAYKDRFNLYIANLGKGTEGAIIAAILGVQQQLTYIVARNVDTTGAPKPGNFVVVVDDGSGHPPDSLLTNVAIAIDAVKSMTETFAVLRPTVVSAAVSMAVTVDPAITHAAVVPLASAAIFSFGNALKIGATFPVSRIASLVFGSSPYVNNVTSITVNGANLDIVPSPFAVVRVTSVTVN